MNIGFKIISRVEILVTSKPSFILTDYCKENIIAFLYLFDMFEGPFIIPLGCNGFQYSGVTGFIEVKIKVNPKAMRIVVISENS